MRRKCVTVLSTGNPGRSYGGSVGDEGICLALALVRMGITKRIIASTVGINKKTLYSWMRNKWKFKYTHKKVARLKV